jgi:ketosteroid isomerase-like protein
VFVAVAALAIVMAGCAQEGAEQAQQMEMAAAVDMAALEAAMEEMRGTWEQAYEAGDVERLVALYAGDGIYMMPFAEAMEGRATIQQVLTDQMMRMPNRQVDLTPSDYGASGELAYEIGTYKLSADVEGEPFEDVGKYLILAKRQTDGSWLIVAHIWNTNLPQVMPG